MEMFLNVFFFPTIFNSYLKIVIQIFIINGIK